MNDEMENIEFKNDHDILIMVVGELKGARADIRELKDGTGTRLHDLENRIEALEGWKEAHMVFEQGQTGKISLLIGIGILLVGLFVWHISGYHL